jgi:hypothetical protein
MISQKNVTVRDTEYLLTQFPATKGLRLLKQIIKLVGPSFAEISKVGEKASEEDQQRLIGLAMEKLFDNLDTVDVEALIKELVTSASKGSVGLNFDVEFAGQYEKMFELVKAIVEFNYGSVFTLVGTIA